MRIAILIPNLVEYDGGAWVVRCQAEELAAQGNYVATFAFAADIKPTGADLFIMGMPKSLFWQRIYRLLFPLDIPKVTRWLHKLKDFDMIIVHLYPLTWLGYLAKKIYKVKYIFWYHGIMDPQFFPYLYERMYIKLQIFLTRLTVRNADRAVAVSRYAQKELKIYTGLDSKVIYNKVNLEGFHPHIDGTEIRKKYNLRDDPVILFVGSLRPVKGVHLLIQAFNLLKQKAPSVKLVIVGRPDYPYYFEELKRMSDDSVVFTNFVPHEDLPLYYATCDVYATCSLWESFNIPIIEAQACGKPVIAFDIGPHPEVIDENGILVEVGSIEKFAQACIEKLKQVREIR